MLSTVCNNVIKEAIDHESKDNISCIFLCFNNLYQMFIDKNILEISSAIMKLRYSIEEFNDLYDNLFPVVFNKQNKSPIFSRTVTLDPRISIFDINQKEKQDKSQFWLCCGLFGKKSDKNLDY